MSKENKLPKFEDIEYAAGLIRNHIHKTPVLTCRSIDEIAAAEIYFKCENFQKAGAFKARGALNAVLQLPKVSMQKGVATHSSGNHAAALARAAKIVGVPAYIVMPRNAPKIKIAAVKQYGGIITFCEPTLDARENILKEVTGKTDAVFIPPYNHPHIIAGQGTAALECIGQVDRLDIIIAPVGGGGLLSGTAISAKHLIPDITVIGAEPEEANDAYLSFKSGKLVPAKNTQTIADGLRTSLGTLTFSIIKKHTDHILTVSETAIVHAMRLIWERMKIIVEPSCAVPLAAVLTYPEFFKGKKTGIILSGGNADLERLPWQI
jgi:threonine dehydratase